MKPSAPLRHYPAMHALRLSLATLVVWDHAFPLTGRPQPLDPIWHLVSPGGFAVWTFFFLSGFLVTRSWLGHSDPLRFAVHRIARIWPGLICALSLTVLLVLVSTGALWQTALPGAWAYWAHNVWLIQWIAYFIPGSFPHNPFPGPNGSLWTLPWEAFAYVFVLGGGILGLLVRRAQANILLLGALGSLVWSSYHPTLWNANGNPFVPYMLGEFLLGMLLAVNLSHLLRRHVLGLSFVALLAGILWGDAQGMRWAMLVFPVLLVYLLSIRPLRHLPDIRQDWSYGTYIYAFPIEQTVIWALPGIAPEGVFFVSMPFILAVAAGSWRWVEQPVLRRAKGVALASFLPLTVRKHYLHYWQIFQKKREDNASR